jgi:hypothetical protein
MSYDDCGRGPSIPSGRMSGEAKVPVRRAVARCAPARCPPTHAVRQCGDEAPIAASSAAIGAGYEDYGDDGYIGAPGDEQQQQQQETGIDPQNADWDCSDGFDMKDKRNHINRRYLLEFRFSMQEAAENPAAAEWRVDSSIFSSFQRRHHESAPGTEKRHGDLSKVIIIGAAVTEVRSDVQTSIVAKFDSIRGNAYTRGQRTPLWITPGTQRIFEVPQVIFMPDDSVHSLTVKQYSALNIEDVMADIIPVGKTNYMYTPIDSPITLVVHHNEHKLGFTLDECPVVDGQYFKFHKDIVCRCRETLEQRVFNCLPFCDLSTWGVKLERADGLCWDNPTNVACMAEDGEIAAYFMQKKNYVAIGLALTYVICDKAVSKTGASTGASSGAGSGK